jgi:hypothetical protein
MNMRLLYLLCAVTAAMPTLVDALEPGEFVCSYIEACQSDGACVPLDERIEVNATLLSPCIDSDGGYGCGNGTFAISKFYDNKGNERFGGLLPQTISADIKIESFSISALTFESESRIVTYNELTDTSRYTKVSSQGDVTVLSGKCIAGRCGRELSGTKLVNNCKVIK